MARTIETWTRWQPYARLRGQLWLSLAPRNPSTEADKWECKEVEVTRKLGEGNNNKIFELRCPTCNAAAALKVRGYGDNMRVSCREIPALTCCQSIPGIPELYWHGDVDILDDGDSRPAVFGMQRLGQNLSTLSCQVGYRMTSQCVAKIGYQLLATLQGIHENGLVFRGLKPENVCIGHGADADQVYLIDFERSVRTRQRYGTPGASGLMTFVFWSLSALQGNPFQPQDDVYSVAYMMLYLRAGKLPWSVGHIWRGRSTPLESLCCDENGQPLEEQFLSFMQHLQDLSIGQVPNYRYLQDLLWEVACGGQADKTDRETKEELLKTVCYDWCTDACLHKKRGPNREISAEGAKSAACNCVCRALPKSEHGVRVQIVCSIPAESDECGMSSESTEDPGEPDDDWACTA